jgi:hypothetical protein
MSTDERQTRRIKNDRMELVVTVGLFVTMAILVLVGIWMVSRVPPQMQTVAQGVFYSTIVLGFGQVLLLVKAKLVHKDVADDLDTTVKVAEKVNGGTARAMDSLTNEHVTSVEAIRQEHEAAIKALREEHKRERHKDVQGWNAEKIELATAARVAERMASERAALLAEEKARVSDLTEKLARCAEGKKADA